MEELKEWFLQYFQVSSDAHIWGVQLAVLVLLTLGSNVVLLRLLDFLAHWADKTPTRWDDVLLRALRVPLRLAVWLTALSVAARVLEPLETNWALVAFNNARILAPVLLSALFITRFVYEVEMMLVAPLPEGTKRQRGAVQLDKGTAHAAGKALRLLVWAVATLMVMQTLGLSVSGVLAFGGLGGIAVGFAAKDLLANFLGGLTVYMDKPFKVGEWVRLPEKNMEGTVEYIGWRSTRIRTFDKRPLYVPNALFTSAVVETPTRMTHRRILETLRLRYEDADKIEAICADVRQMLHQSKDIVKGQTLMVNLTACAPEGLDVLLWCYTKTKALVEYHAVKQRVLLDIMKIVQQHGAQFAFPTRTVLLADGVQQLSFTAPQGEKLTAKAPQPGL